MGKIKFKLLLIWPTNPTQVFLEVPCKNLLPTTGTECKNSLLKRVFCRRSLEEEDVLYERVKNLEPQTKPYYQALIDNRDIPYVVSMIVVLISNQCCIP